MSEPLGWWSISGEAFLDALHEVSRGADPEVVYTEMYANSEVEKVPPAEFGQRLLLEGGEEAVYCGPSLHEGIHEVVIRHSDGEWMTQRLSIGVNPLIEAIERAEE